MIALSDLDLMVVLAQTDLITEALHVLDVQNQNVTVTSDVFQRARNSKGFKNLGLSNAAKLRLVGLVKQSQHISNAQDVSVLAVLADEGIDSGEALLFAAACTDDDSVVVTGDKRALNDLAQLPDLSDRLINRVVCLENLFLMMFDVYSFNAIHQKVITALDSGECQNKTLKLCMKSDHTEEDARACMNSGINALEKIDLLVLS